MDNHKIEIENTRRGCLGGSDGDLLARVANLGYVPKSAHKRLAIVKGLIDVDNVTTRAMEFGNFIEGRIFDILQEKNKGMESNPLWVSKAHSMERCKLICHPDFVFKDEEKKILHVYECKATKASINETRNTYYNQLYIEWVLGNEMAKELGSGWSVRLYLCHYNTQGIDLENDEIVTFDASRLEVSRIFMRGEAFDVHYAMALIDDFLETFSCYIEGDEVDSALLPERVREEFNAITCVLQEIKEKEKKVEEFKTRLCKFMQDNNIKSVKNDLWNIVLVEASESTSFDSKTFLAELSLKHPRKARKIRATYVKKTKRGAYVSIKLKQ